MPHASDTPASPAAMRIVIVCLEFARAQRMRSLAEGLSALGHEVVFLTSEAGASDARFTVVPVPFTSAGARAKSVAGLDARANLAAEARHRGIVAEKLVRFVARVIDVLFLHPDKYRGWIAACRAYLGAQPAELAGVDLVIASTPPPSAMFVGRDVALHTGAPLIYDFRDLWTGNLYYPYGPLRKAIDRRAEESLVRHAVGLAVVTKALAAELHDRWPALPSTAIYTGVDAAEFTRETAPPPAERLRLGHVGVTYGGRRSIRPLLASLTRLSDAGRIDGEHISLDLIGEMDDDTRKALSESSLQHVTIHGHIDRDAVPAALDAIDVAILLMWPEDLVSVPLKTHHYLAAGKTVLLVGASPQSELVGLIGDLPGVHVCSTPEQTDAAVTAVWERWRAGESLWISPADRPMPVTRETETDAFLALAEKALSR